jgi:archaellum component FlaC
MESRIEVISRDIEKITKSIIGIESKLSDAVLELERLRIIVSAGK